MPNPTESQTAQVVWKVLLAATRERLGSSEDSNLRGEGCGSSRCDRHTSALPRLRDRPGIGPGPCRPGQAVRGLLYRSAFGRRPQERRTTGGSDCAGAHGSATPISAPPPWSDQEVLTRVRERVLPSITREEPVQAWIIDDTGFPKKGSHSVGVARQYCGQLGKQDNCQIAVSLSVATHRASLPVACIYPRSGPMIQTAARSPECPTTSASRPSRISHCGSCAGSVLLVRSYSSVPDGKCHP